MSHGMEIAYAFILTLLSISIIILVIALVLSCRRHPIESKESTLNRVEHSARMYAFSEIDVVTDGFNPRRIIGNGRLGTTYTAVLERGELIVVKRIHSHLVLCNPGFGFAAMVKSLSLCQHPHIVSIVGFSEAPGERILVMELAGMMSLDYYLHQNGEEASLLDWGQRLRIAGGVARGLEYLHEKMAPKVVHGCVKASNVLIDGKFCAKLSDYGLSFLAPRTERAGLVGYVDEEYWGESGGGASKESDVFGFGVLLLELLSGRRSEEGLLAEWALPLIREMRMNEIFDPRLVIPNDVKPLVRLAKVASACVGNSRKNRPSIAQVTAILNNVVMEFCL
ncbi:hypothetical protein Ancab_033884 [Ancistrocladus abbreviatus]